MTGIIKWVVGRTLVVSAAVCGWRFYEVPTAANPSGGTAASGTATFSTSGTHETITTSATAYINWNSFNIGVGETTTFVQPTSSSVVWNQINDANPSQILGTLNANGFVVLQNQAGLYIGGQASISTHGLILTTASGPAPNLSSGGAWQFDMPPPTAKIINYGQINIAGGGSAFLLANDIENNGTIFAPGGKIGLYAGEQVLISSAPDGRGLSTEVTLPQGSVDNEGKLIADAGTIAAQAKTVNQNGLIQADSVQDVNGTIELVASDSLTLGAASVITAKGDSAGNSAGGSVTIKSANQFADQSGSVIDISGGAQRGNGGQAEISAPNMVSFNSIVTGQAAAGFANGEVTIDPVNVYLTAGGTAKAGYTSMAFSSFSGVSINVMADQNIEIGGLWSLPFSSSPALLTLVAGNNITLDNNSSIEADTPGDKWGISLTAGNAFVPTAAQPLPASGSDGIYLNGSSSFIQTQTGNINLTALNEVIVNSTVASSATDGIRTLDGGNIVVNAIDGGVNTGANTQGYLFNGTAAPYYTVSSVLGGISTMAGGNVTINAGGNVTSYLPGASDTGDPGTGTFGSQPGNLTINAGGTVTGNYVVANGVGRINAGVNVGAPTTSGSFALSLINGSWIVNAPNGDIYLQEIRNPNGVFNNLQSSQRGGGSAGQYLFNYGQDDSVSLDAEGVTLTSQSLPRLASGLPSSFALYPPILDITAGSGGVNLDGNVTLFSSPDQNLNITTTDGGSFSGINGAQLFMSYSSAVRWMNSSSFTTADQSATLPVEANNPNPVVIDVSGNMQNLTLITSKETSITVGGNMLNCSFSGQNLQASDITSITVGGQIFNQGSYAFVDNVSIPSVPIADLLTGIGNNWDSIFGLALNPSQIPSPTALANQPMSQWLLSIIRAATLFNTTYANGNYMASSDKGFIYNTSTSQLGFGGPMLPSLLATLTQPFTILTLVNGAPVIGANGKFETQTVNWVNPAQLLTLYTESLPDSSPLAPAIGYRVGGPGTFDVNAGSISLGNSYGILSCGVADPTGGFGRYGDLASVTPQGATLNVTVAGDLNMLTSTIATLGGGNVNVTSTGGTMDLGAEGLYSARQVGLGVYSSGGGNVSLTAYGDINVDGSRIGTFDGGDIFVESYDGNVNVGSGSSTLAGSFLSYVDPSTGLPGSYAENVAGSGIVANTLVPGTLQQGYPPKDVAIATLPGNVTIYTPDGDINTSRGGILQIALDGSSTPGPTITLTAGSTGHVGNINLGLSGVIGGTINATANGNISGEFISRQNSTITAAENINVTVLSSGDATVNGGGTVSGSIVGTAVTASGNVTASVLSQNASTPNGSGSTLGKATASAASQSAAQQANSASQQLANNDSGLGNQTDDKKPLIRRVKRVTVILPKST